jgi:hypothetical protein
MGMQRAMEFAELVRQGQMKLDVALYDHLENNHVPRLSFEVWGDLCKRALDEVRRAPTPEEIPWDKEFDHPTEEDETVTVQAIFEGFHLHPFL